MIPPDPAPGHPLGDGCVALAVDRPESIEALQDAVAHRVAEGHAIYPQGGRTALDYGGIPRAPGVAIDTTGLARVIDYPAADMTITIEAGLTLSALRAVLAASGQRLPIDPPYPDRATLGGIFACNATGSRRLGSGRPRDMILGVGVVTSDGKVVKGGGRVVKNVAGYDLPKLMTGSLGTLGILAQMTLKVRPRPEAAALAWLGYPHLDAVAEALSLLNTSATRPASLDLLNQPAVRLAAGSRARPESPWVLAVGFEDNTASVSWQIDRLKEETGRSDAAVLEGTAAEAAWSTLNQFPAAEVGPLSVVAGVCLSAVAPFAALLDPGRWAILAHAGHGVIHAQALGDEGLESLGPEVVRLRAEAARHGGHMVLSRCPSAWKDHLKVWGNPRPDWDLAGRIKRALDPPGLLNPGRFVTSP